MIGSPLVFSEISQIGGGWSFLEGLHEAIDAIVALIVEYYGMLAIITATIANRKQSLDQGLSSWRPLILQSSLGAAIFAPPQQ